MKINQKVQLTLTGYNELVKELEELKAKLPLAIERVSKAREFGDLSENAEYHAAREDHANMIGRMDELADIINRANIMQPTTSTTQIGVGSKVQVEINGTVHTFIIVGEWEADPTQKKISHASPLGQALMGRKAGEKVEVEAPAGKVVYHIKEIL